MFASRLRPGPGRNLLSHALERRRSANLPVWDLTQSNPTTVGLTYPDALLSPLSEPEGLVYQPQPFGLPQARQAVADDYRRRNVDVSVDRIVLTASTSEAYSFLFKLLCDPGDTILTPRPSYPLIEHLASLDGIGMTPYSLEYHGCWTMDVEAIRTALRGPAGGQIRAIVLITPNNPTGSIVNRSDLQQLHEIAVEFDLALIADEVFADYPIEAATVPSVLTADAKSLTFALGGLSKTIGLPQAKLGWIGVAGNTTTVESALERLETICDAYLSVSTAVQIAARRLLTEGATIRSQILERLRYNYGELRHKARSCSACTVLRTDAGWYAVVQIPAVVSEERFVGELLEDAGILVHPGYFYDFEREAYLAISLLLPPETFAHALDVLFDRVVRMA